MDNIIKLRVLCYEDERQAPQIMVPYSFLIFFPLKNATITTPNAVTTSGLCYSKKAALLEKKELHNLGVLDSTPGGRAKSDEACIILEMPVAVLTTYKKSIGTDNGSSSNSNAEGCIIITIVGLRWRDLRVLAHLGPIG